MELRQQLEESLDVIAPDYPTTVGELLTDLQGVAGYDEVVDFLERLNQDFVVEDRMQMIDLVEDPDYVGLDGVDLDYGGHSPEYDSWELDDEA